MRPDTPTFWLLDGLTGWRTARAIDVAVAGKAGIRLAASDDGPLALDEPGGSLGGLVLPRGMAFDRRHRLHLLDSRDGTIRVFDADRQAFISLPTLGGEGSEARQFRAPGNIAIHGNDLYVADGGNARVQVFSLQTLALRYLWKLADGWDPVDLASCEQGVVILDRQQGRVFLHRQGEDHLHRIIAGSPNRQRRWQRITVDRQQRICLLDTTTDRPKLDVFAMDGRHLGEFDDAGELLDRFDAPLIRLDHRQRFCLPDPLAQHCADPGNVTRPSVAMPLAACLVTRGGLLFHRNGEPLVPPAEPETAGPALYRRTGSWISQALDSRIHDCQWHRIELTLADLPVGTRLVIHTYTDNTPRSLEEIEALPAHLWQTAWTMTGDMQTAAGNAASQPRQTDTLVLSHEGRYLWLRLELSGDGYASPVVTALRCHYPRDSYLKYLPAVYSADDESRRFLERFLSLFQQEWDAMEQAIEDTARLFDPDAVPAGGFMAYLARWLALPMEGSWSDEQRRRLLAAAASIYPQRGTPRSLRRYLQIYLINLTGLEEHQLGAFPLLIEGFRQRDYLGLDSGEHAILGGRHPLWSPAVVGRLQLDVFAREGEVRLVSTGDPERDVFHVHAHRFQVVVPAAWIRTRDDEAMIRRALDAEKPAHTQYQLCLVEPRFRVGIQSTIGLDSIIGDYPRAVLACGNDDGLPPSRAPRQRLGYDTVLSGGRKQDGGMPVGQETRIGINTQLS